MSPWSPECATRASRILAQGCRLIPFETARSNDGPRAWLRVIIQSRRLLRRETPDVVHCISLDTTILSGIAAKWAGARALILAPTGLGHAWTIESLPRRVWRSVIRTIVGEWLRGPHTWYLFENGDDPQEFWLAASDPHVTIVPGAGVDPLDFPVTPEPPSPPLKVAVVSRMLKAKGVAEAVEAVRLARSRAVPVELDIYGAPDDANPTSIPETTLIGWSKEPGICWHGPTNDVASVWRTHHATLYLTSYREGIPRSLVEAAASGRPIIATDVVGCRDLVRDGREGLLVPPGDTEAAAAAIVKLAADADLRLRLGNAAHARFRERFTEAHVRHIMELLYSSLNTERPALASEK